MTIFRPRAGLILMAAIGAAGAFQFAARTSHAQSSGSELPDGLSSTRQFSVLNPIVQSNLAVYPVVAAPARSENWLTLDEGLETGEVSVRERGAVRGLDRRYPRPVTPPFNPGGDWPEAGSADVNRLVLTNGSSRPLLLLAGEIVIGGKQDRVIARDRIVKGHSGPVDLAVFCVEPNRWGGSSNRFGIFAGAIASPAVRLNALVDRNQQKVWDEVAKASRSFAAVGGFEPSSSSYADAAKEARKVVDDVAAPVGASMEEMIVKLRERKAVGVVVAVDGVLVWADIFADGSLFEKYWPKLIRSYAAEALPGRFRRADHTAPPSAEAKKFLETMKAYRATAEAEPGVYSNTEIMGIDFQAFLLTSLLHQPRVEVHLTKMLRADRRQKL